MNKILGSIQGAAFGDALGASTELLSRQQIQDIFGGIVEDFVTAPEGVLVSGREKGIITDDFSAAYFIMQELISSHGRLDDEIAKNALINWAESPKGYTKFAGPTTLKVIENLKKGDTSRIALPYSGIGIYNHLATDGAAMKIFPIGLLYKRQTNQLIDAVMTICKPTHFTNQSVSGACAIACAVGEAACLDATVDSVIEAGLFGAKEGHKRASSNEEFENVAGQSIYRKIKFAVKLGENSSDMFEAIDDIADLIGTGVMACEAVPATFGFVSAFRNKPIDAVIAAANAGQDTDTVASMTGAIIGALYGSDIFNHHQIKKIEEVNEFNFENLANEFRRIIHEK